VEWQRDGYTITIDPRRLDRELVHEFLRESYWSPNVPREVVERSIEHSLTFGLYAPDGSQAGFARVVTDRAVFAYLADVFVVEQHRGRGLGVWLVETVLSHPDLRDLRRIALGTRDAHELYARFGFEPADPEVLMTLDRSAGELYGDGAPKEQDAVPDGR
jgi:GNAT superfamily N-acetyltransferase